MYGATVKIGITNSSTRLHLVGDFYMIYSMMHGSMNIKFTEAILAVSFSRYKERTKGRVHDKVMAKCK
jgi:hypothetical protein